MTIRFSLRNALLIAGFALLNIGDLLSTWIDLHSGMREGNPFMSMLLAQHGFGALIAYKAVVVGVVGVVVSALWDSRPRLVGWTLVACDLLVFSAVAVNVMQMLG